MKQKILILLLALTASSGLMSAANGIGKFSVSETQQVTFSPGNLQFNAVQGTHQCADGSTLQGTWRFAENQWDIVGMGYGQTNADNYCYIGGTVQSSDNRNISSTYNGWIDLFGFGTSGWNSGANAYQPWSTSQTNSNYYPGGSFSYGNNLTGDYAKADWGVYNQIGDDDPGTWRTLTQSEWSYLISSRANASRKKGVAKVNGITGVVILPDVFTLPAGCGFTAGVTSASSWYDWSYVNTTNIYTSAQWQLMEAAGAVFLPCAGSRRGTTMYDAGTGGLYWSSTAVSSAYYLGFDSNDLYFTGSVHYYGRSVRLVRLLSDLEDTPETYTVTFVNYDGSELQSSTVKAGTMPEYNGATPSKPATAQYTYTFAGWTPEITAVTGNATYMAVYTSVPNGGNNNGIGKFSVSATQQVTFSPGNLQYNAAQGTHQCADGKTLQGTWRFAENQWDIVGMGYGQTNTDRDCYIGGTVGNGDNRNISSTYNGWIDLFGWGTSGWESGANAYQPWSTSSAYEDYYPGGSSSNNLTGNYANADWGVYNQIGDDDPGTWRTLTLWEWSYLISLRANASSKYGAAKVNGMTGVVILPDVFTMPVGCGFTAGMTSASNWYDWSLVNTTNIYTTAQWQLMESAGAVFLPCAGERGGTTMLHAGSIGYYWSSTGTDGSYNAIGPLFGPSHQYTGYSSSRYDGRSVRLVRSLSGLDDTPETYTVTFVNYDGSELQSSPVEEGTMPSYDGEIPVKTADDQYSYTFAGWTPEVVAVSDDVTYTATFTSELNKYTITFMNGNDVLQSEKVEYGAMPQYNGNTPTKPADAQYIYTFAGWTPELAAVTGDATYQATFTPEVRKYTVTFYDEDGTTVLGAPQTVDYGSAVVAPEVEIPQCLSLSWDNDFFYVTGNLAVKAVWTGTIMPTYSASASDETQGTVTVTQEPTCEDRTLAFRADAAEGYEFVRWSDGNTDNPRSLTLTQDIVLTAVFEPVIVCGTIETTDGTTIWEDELPYTWEDKTFTEAGTQTTTLKSVDGCDSVVTFTLRVRYNNIVLQENENADYYTSFAEDYNGQRVNTATLNRQFTQGKWATLCLPFNVNKAMMMALGLYNRVFAFRYAQQLDDETIQVFFAPAQSIEAGKGYIVNANTKLAQKTSFVFPNVTINTDSDNGDITALTGYNDGTNRGNLFLVGTLRTGILQGTTSGNTYLGLKDNQLYYPNSTSGTPMRAYRAVFRSDMPINASRVRIIAEGEDNVELIIDNGQLSKDDKQSARKYIENGILYIERNGITYTAQGQRID